MCNSLFLWYDIESLFSSENPEIIRFKYFTLISSGSKCWEKNKLVSIL